MLPNRRHLLGRRRRHRRHRRRARDRARPGRPPESRRAAAALGLRGRHRPGLPARRRHRARHPQVARPAGLDDHERRHRIECRYRARARRKADQRRRPASGRRLRFRPDHRDRPSRRAEGHPARHQYRRRARHHRAGLQVRVPEFPDRADADPRRLRCSRRRSSTSSARRRRRSSSCTSTIPSAPRCRRALPR